MPTGAAARAILATFLVVAAPAIAGCFTRDDVVKSVRTRCEGLLSPLESEPEPRPLERARPDSPFALPFQGTVRVTLLVPSAGDDASAEGAEAAAAELNQAGAPIQVRVVPVPGVGAAAGLEAFQGATGRTPPSAVVSALDADSTEGMIDEAHARRVPLVATAATAERLVSAHPGAGYFFRVPAPDPVEGRAIADLVWASGCRTANVVYGPTERANDVRVAFRHAFEALGGSVGVVVKAASPKDAIERVEFLAKAGKDEPRPEAIVVIASPSTSAALLREAYERKVSARSVLFFAGEAKSASFVQAAGRDDQGHLLAPGLRGIAPMRADTPATGPFLDAHGARSDLDALNLTMRAYDAVYLATIAATCARSPEPHLVAARLPTIANADTGDTDVSGADPYTALVVGANCLVNYVGVTHDHDWSPRGEPVTAQFHVWQATADGAIRVPVTRYEPRAG